MRPSRSSGIRSWLKRSVTDSLEPVRSYSSCFYRMIEELMCSQSSKWELFLLIWSAAEISVGLTVRFWAIKCSFGLWNSLCGRHMFNFRGHISIFASHVSDFLERHQPCTVAAHHVSAPVTAPSKEWLMVGWGNEWYDECHYGCISIM